MRATTVPSKLKRILLWVLVIEGAMWVVGRVISKKMSFGDEASDNFRVVVIAGGREFRSVARNLRSGTAIASMGGIDLDLRQATLDLSGAELEVNATMGGVQVSVPAGWGVYVDKETLAGGLASSAKSPDELPDDAPVLRIRAVARFGGISVTAQEE